MRCSSSESLLDEYVDGTLPPRKAAMVAAHVAACPDCARLLEELRVIDALLISPRLLEPAANFTHKTMAEIRSMPAPRAHRSRPLAVLGTYLVFAWLAIGAFFAFSGPSAHEVTAMIAGSLNFAFDAAAHVSSVSAGLVGPHERSFAEAGGAILVVDLLFLFGVIALYLGVRSRMRSGGAA